MSTANSRLAGKFRADRTASRNGGLTPKEGVFRLDRVLAAEGSRVMWGDSAADDPECFEHPESGHSMPAATVHSFMLHCESLLDEALLAASGDRPVVRRVTPRERAARPSLGPNAAIVVCPGARQCLPEFDWRTSDTFALTGIRAEKAAAVANLLDGAAASVTALLRGRAIAFDDERVLLCHRPTQQRNGTLTVTIADGALSTESDAPPESSALGVDE